MLCTSVFCGQEYALGINGIAMDRMLDELLKFTDSGLLLLPLAQFNRSYFPMTESRKLLSVSMINVLNLACVIWIMLKACVFFMYIVKKISVQIYLCLVIIWLFELLCRGQWARRQFHLSTGANARTMRKGPSDHLVLNICSESEFERVIVAQYSDDKGIVAYF